MELGEIDFEIARRVLADYNDKREERVKKRLRNPDLKIEDLLAFAESVMDDIKESKAIMFRGYTIMYHQEDIMPRVIEVKIALEYLVRAGKLVELKWTDTNRPEEIKDECNEEYCENKFYALRENWEALL